MRFAGRVLVVGSFALACNAERLENVETIVSNAGAFAALRKDGSVVAWGASAYGGYNQEIDGLQDATSIASTTIYTWDGSPAIGGYGAFASVTKSGDVVTWGSAAAGGEGASDLIDFTSGNDVVTKVFSSSGAFAALRSDGSVKTWGATKRGGMSNAVESVRTIFSNYHAFVALKEDGAVVTWGDPLYGGNSTGVDFSVGVKTIVSTAKAFAALMKDGSVRTWGLSSAGGDSTTVDFVSGGGVKEIISNIHSFAALKNDGSVVTWGWVFGGGNSSGVDFLSGGGVKTIVPSYRSFAAVKNDGSLVAWGQKDHGSEIPDEFFTTTTSSSSAAAAKVKLLASSNAQGVFAHFAAVLEDNSIVVWGGNYQYKMSPLEGGGVSEMYSNSGGFAVVLDDGSVHSWLVGSPDKNLAAGLDFAAGGGIGSITCTQYAFAALLKDGSVLAWGNSPAGILPTLSPTSNTATTSWSVPLFVLAPAIALL